MALVKCRECGKKISKKATACPDCGAPRKSGSFLGSLAKILIIFVFVVYVVGLVSNPDGTSSTASVPAKPLTAEEKRKAQIKKSFSAWDGSHYELVKWTKARMNDPDSFEHDKTTYADGGEYLIVEMDFRGKNAFGGVVRQSAVAKVTLDGQILEAGID